MATPAAVRAQVARNSTLWLKSGQGRPDEKDGDGSRSVKADATFVALSGITAGQKRLQGSSHNLANLLTEDFHPVRTSQEEVAEGGTRATQERAQQPEPVSIAKELIDQELAALQIRASIRAVDTALKTLGGLLDIKS